MLNTHILLAFSAYTNINDFEHLTKKESWLQFVRQSISKRLTGVLGGGGTAGRKRRNCIASAFENDELHEPKEKLPSDTNFTGTTWQRGKRGHGYAK